MTDRQSEEQLTPVPLEAKPVGEIRDRWSWAEPSVWTDRMLTALETGVKGGRWYSLMDKVCSVGNLRAAFAMVKANKGSPGVDHQTIEMFEARLEENLGRMVETLRTGVYRPQAIKRVWIPKPGTGERRPLGIPTVRDRVVQAALRNVLEPVLERDFAAMSYGFRPGRGCKDALREVATLLTQGCHFVVDADLKSYFDTIPHDMLMTRLREKIADKAVLSLVESFLHQRVMDTAEGWTPETGTPQGAVLSPLLSNIFLDPLDHLMARSGIAMVRLPMTSSFRVARRLRRIGRRLWLRAGHPKPGLRFTPQKPVSSMPPPAGDSTSSGIILRGGCAGLGLRVSRSSRQPSVPRRSVQMGTVFP